jgi:small ligand-binding sensory domain FIST
VLRTGVLPGELMPSKVQTTLKFAAAVSRERDSRMAGTAVAQATRRELGGKAADLACLFFSPQHVESAEALVEAVREEVSPRLLIGCSGEGVIGGGEEIESAPAVSLWTASLPGVARKPFRLTADRDDYGISMTGWPDNLDESPERPAFLLLADPFSTPMAEVLSHIADRCHGAPAIGGLAGGGRDQGDNRMVLDGDVYDGGLVGVALSGPLAIRTVVSQGCRPIGERYVVTRAEHNVIHELSGEPALERLKALFGSLSDEEQRLAQRALHIGVVMDEQRNRFERGDFLVRNLIGADQRSGSVAIGDVVREGQTVQFHLRDAQSATEDFHLMLAAERARHHQPPLGALVFSCCGRGRGLFGRPHHDVSVLKERVGDVPTAGFFAQGEIGHVGGSNFLHGYTASVALFSEPDA